MVLENKNRFALRKKSFGLCSVAIGSFIVMSSFGITQASANELTDENFSHAVILEEVVTKDQAVTEEEVVTEEQAVTEEVAVTEEEVVTEEQAVTEEVAVTEQEVVTEEETVTEEEIHLNQIEEASSLNSNSNELELQEKPQIVTDNGVQFQPMQNYNQFQNFPSQNVISYTGGGVDVTPLEAKKLETGDIQYSFQVSFAGITSSDHVQTATSYSLVVPSLLKDIKITQIGTYDGDKLKDAAGDWHYTDIKKTHDAAVDILLPLEMIKEYEGVEYPALSDAFDLRDQLLREYTGDEYSYAGKFGNLATLDEVRALKAKGFDYLPGGIVDRGYTATHSSYQPKGEMFTSTKGYASPEEAIKQFKLSQNQELDDEGFSTVRRFAINSGTLSSRFPIAIRLDYVVTKEQAQKTPILPLWAGLEWRAYFESREPDSHEDGSQNLTSYGDFTSAYQFLAHPEVIQETQLSKDGLAGTQVGLNQYTGDWKMIGNDVTSSTFNYVETFNLHSNPSITYYASENG
ncbi:YSIRK-type signal peptide-containing protein [Facklamia sp. P13064]|uniref:YSIRK-type signal peptide-containing protein n=1 Tax=Facklamia sp. P13064 TaxID=3421953 RepID=UPI003D177330